jgi:hypothetical protein
LLLLLLLLLLHSRWCGVGSGGCEKYRQRSASAARNRL